MKWLAWMTSLFCSLSKIHDLPVMMESNHFSASLEMILSHISQMLIIGLCRKSSGLESVWNYYGGVCCDADLRSWQGLATYFQDRCYFQGMTNPHSMN